VGLDGRIAFRGFQGEYECVLTLEDGRTATAKFAVLPPERGPTTAASSTSMPVGGVEVRLQLNRGTGALTWWGP